ncbi:MAG: hypothetical protein V4773_11770 [Verrucomicrobiota bacterium]
MKLSPRFIAVIRRTLFAFAGLATAFALFIAVENWRGSRAWAATARDLAARGEPLDLAAIQPARVPDAENLWKAPMLAKLLYDRPDDPAKKEVEASTRLDSFQALNEFRGKRARDFTALRDRLRTVRLLNTPLSDSPAADVLAAMEPLQPLLDEVREAARTRRRAELEPRETPLGPPLVDAGTVFTIGVALSVRASAAVELDRPAEAADDILAAQRLGNALAHHPATLLNIMVAAAIHGFATDAVSAGCRRQTWTQAQLARFEQNLAALHPLANFREALRSERVQVFYALDTKPALPGLGPSWPAWLFSGWAQQNKVTYSRRLESEVLSLIQLAPERIAPLPPPQASASAAAKPAKPSLLSPYSAMSELGLHRLSRIFISYGESIDRLRLASLSWTIERYRLVHSREPASLEELVPAFLPAFPQGVFDGQPLRATTSPQGERRFYSFGSNGRDEQGSGDDIVFPAPDPS